MNCKRTYLPVLLLCAVACVRLGPDPDLAGGNSSETISFTVTGMSIEGRTVPGSKVGIFSLKYAANYALGYGIADTVTADSAGYFIRAGLDEGYYNVLAVHPAKNLKAFIPSVPVLRGDPVQYRNCKLEPPGRISGTALSRFGDTLRSGFIYVKGSPFIDPIDSSAFVHIEGIPTGTYLARFWREDRIPFRENDSITVVLQDSMIVSIQSDSATAWGW
jgi:hypothetical protein